ncbi:MAG: EAL domain-containing protein [Planctomycetes bacterium]|nr:EAL domain-containing protein [Planctomycetota bacterium]
MSTSDWEERLGDVLAELGRALGATRAALYEARARTQPMPRVEWRETPPPGSGGTRAFPRWIDALSHGGAILGPVAGLPPEEREPLAAEGVRSVLAVSVFAGNLWWGSMLLEDSVREREWSHDELQVVMAAARALGAAFVHERALRDLKVAEARYHAIVEDQTELICRFDDHGSLTFINEAFAHRFGLPHDVARGTSLQRVLPGEAEGTIRSILGTLLPGGLPAAVEHVLVLADGGEVWVRWSIRAIADASGGLLEYQAVGTDVTERRHLMEELEHEAYYDDLTGIANRRMFTDRGRRDLSLARREGWSAALLLVDLDRFKDVNDSLGHAAGDDALTQIAGRLERAIRLESLLARMGGDEYAVLVSKLADAEIAAVGRRLMDAIEAPLLVHDHTVRLSASIGVAVFPRDGNDLEDLMRHADAAMYRAKARGGGIRFYNENIDSQAQERFGLESDLREALESGALRLHYQPVRKLETGKVIGGEALCRWSHPGRGAVPPSKFIELVEGSELGVGLDRWVTTTAIGQLGAWRAVGWEGWLSVNLSPRTIEVPGLAGWLRGLLSAAGVPPGALVLEMTERVLAEPERVVPVFRELRELGVQVAVDDFGAGYASFAYLEQFPLDLLKIDQQFVRRPWSQVRADAIVRSMVALGHSLGLQALAEGIETREQLASVRDAGCDCGQGFLLGRPVPADEFERAFVEAGASEGGAPKAEAGI